MGDDKVGKDSGRDGGKADRKADRKVERKRAGKGVGKDGGRGGGNESGKDRKDGGRGSGKGGVKGPKSRGKGTEGKSAQRTKLWAGARGSKALNIKPKALPGPLKRRRSSTGETEDKPAPRTKLWAGARGSRALNIKPKAVPGKKRRTSAGETEAESIALAEVADAIERFKNCSVEDFEELKDAMGSALIAQSGALGCQLDAMRVKVNQAITDGKLRFEQMKKKRRVEVQADHSKKAVETTGKEDEALESICAEFGALVETAEQQTANLRETVEPIVKGNMEDLEAVRAAFMSIDELSAAVRTAHQQCTDCVLKQGLMRFMANTTRLGPNSEVRLIFRLLERFKVSMKSAQGLMDVVMRTRKKAKAKLGAGRRAALFSKYDADGDGFLNKDEVHEFAWSEYGFELSPDTKNRIFETLDVDSAGGIAEQDFTLLKMAVGIARNYAREKEAPPDDD